MKKFTREVWFVIFALILLILILAIALFGKKVGNMPITSNNPPQADKPEKNLDEVLEDTPIYITNKDAVYTASSIKIPAVKIVEKGGGLSNDKRYLAYTKASSDNQYLSDGKIYIFDIANMTESVFKENAVSLPVLVKFSPNDKYLEVFQSTSVTGKLQLISLVDKQLVFDEPVILNKHAWSNDHLVIYASSFFNPDIQRPYETGAVGNIYSYDLDTREKKTLANSSKTTDYGFAGSLPFEIFLDNNLLFFRQSDYVIETETPYTKYSSTKTTDKILNIQTASILEPDPNSVIGKIQTKVLALEPRDTVVDLVQNPVYKNWYLFKSVREYSSEGKRADLVYVVNLTDIDNTLRKVDLGVDGVVTW